MSIQKNPFPRKIKILDTVYKIKYHNTETLIMVVDDTKEESSVNGFVDFDTCTINIRTNGRPYSEIWSDIWHEIGHVIKSYFKIKMTDDLEELFMNLFTLGCNSVIMDNELKFDFSKKRRI